MKVLLDETLPLDFRHFLPEHDVATVAALQGFEVLLTVDRGIPRQQNWTELPLAVVVIRTQSNSLEALIPIVPAIIAALKALKPRTVIEVTEPSLD